MFDGVLARFAVSLTILDQNRAERIQAELVSGNYFAVLGLRPTIGRVLAPSDEVSPGAHPVVVLAHGFWMRRYGGNPALVGQTIRLNGHPMTVVGVGPARFKGTEVGSVPDLFVSLMMKAQMTPTWDTLLDRRSLWLNLTARLRHGVSRGQAEASINVLFRQIREQEWKEINATSERFKKAFIGTRLLLLPGHKGLSSFREQFSTPIIVLMSMVGLVLLIARANVANLLMARAPARQREMAIRLALGASRGRIVRQLLVESVVLAALGGGVGVLLSVWAGGLLLRALPFESASQAFSAAPDLRVLVFTLGTSLLAGVLFGLLPAWQTVRPRLVGALKEDGGSVVSSGHVRVRKGLVIAQVALSLLLLVGAGLFTRSLFNLRSLDPGFRTQQLLTFSLDPTLSGYAGPRVLAFYTRVQERIAQQPGVAAVSMASSPPLTDTINMSTVTVEGYQAKDGEDMNPHVNSVGPDYSRTMGMALGAGREFTQADRAGAPKVAVVSEKMARYFFGNLNPVGRRFGFRRDNATDIEIVGVARDGKDLGLRDEIARMVYIPFGQDTDLGQLTFYVRTAASILTADSVRRLVREIDATIPLFDVKTMDRVVDESLFLDRMVALLSACFGGLATLLAAVGLYGVMSYTVARRTREIGLRMALGAARSSVVWLVMRDVTVLAVAGLAAGLPAAIGVSRLVASQLFGVSPTDPLTLVASTVTLLTVALLAGYIPADRAARVDPMFALRHE